MRRYRTTLTTLTLPDGNTLELRGREVYDDGLSNPIKQAARERHNRAIREKREGKKRVEQARRAEWFRPPGYWDDGDWQD